MLQVQLNNIEIGQQFQIRNSWRNMLMMHRTKEEYPFQFRVDSIVHNTNKTECYFICKSIQNDKKDKVVRLMVSESIIQYATSNEVETCNVGLYFKDYLPLENEKLIIKDCKDNMKLYPCRFSTVVDVDQEMQRIRFEFISLLDNQSVSYSTYSKNSWKILNGSDVYMSDVEKMYQDTFIHKGIVSEVCNKFADYLELNGQVTDAEDLRQRARYHDNSKITNKDEFRALTSIINDKSCLKDANSRLSQFKQDAIELHWANNEHHPEHYDNINDMPSGARKEFVCDCCARSIQYGTDLVEFMTTRLNERFNFSDIIKEEILYNCKLVLTLMSKKA